jgi:serralysin
MATITGTAGPDVLTGGPGADQIFGLGGADTLTGGTGGDIFTIGQGESPTSAAANNHLENLVRITDFDNNNVDPARSDKLVFAGEVAGSFTNSVGIHVPDIATAISQADTLFQFRPGIVFVEAEVGTDLVIIDDQHEAVVLSNLSFATFNALDIADGRGASPPVSPPPPPPPPPLEPQIPEPTLPPPPGASHSGADGTITGNMDTVHIGALIGEEIDTEEANDFSLSGPLGGIDLSGAGFTYDANDLFTGGAITRITYTNINAGGVLHAQLTLPGIPAAQFDTWVLTDNTQAAFSTFLAGADSIRGGPNADLLRGFAGNDFLVGDGGQDTIFGGTGDDVIDAAARDTGAVDGPTFLRGEEGDDYIIGGPGFDDANGNMGNDTISTGAGDDFSVGGKDNDLLFGDDGNDIVWGNLGNDTCDGGNGDDQVRGGQGDDVLFGGAGNDFVSGDRGNDTEAGGAGADIFHGSQDAGIDRVLDFHLEEGDRVMLDPGTHFTISQVGADTVIDMGPSPDGSPNQMILVGVQMSTLTGNWIFGA